MSTAKDISSPPSSNNSHWLENCAVLRFLVIKDLSQTLQVCLWLLLPGMALIFFSSNNMLLQQIQRGCWEVGGGRGPYGEQSGKSQVYGVRISEEMMLEEWCERRRVDATCVPGKLRPYVGSHTWWAQTRTQTWLIVDIACDYQKLWFSTSFFSWGSLRSSL